MSSKNPKTTGARWCALLLPAGLALLPSACLVNLEDRCGEHQHYDSDAALCRCDDDFALSDNRCVRCGENEVGSSSGCVCAEGFSRAKPDAACEALASLGQACASNADCGDARYGYCYLASGASTGYCTAPDCATAADCPTDYGCNTRQSPSFCEMPPDGLGTPCKTAGDCEGHAASYCESVSAHACLVNDCAADPNKCHGDWVCCDIGLLSQSLCIPPDELDGGNCPAGGTLVPRTK